MTFDLGWHWKVKSRSFGVHWAVYHTLCIISQRSCQAERPLVMWIEQSHIWPFRLNITYGWLQKLNPGYEICIISYQVNLCSEVSAMFNSLMPSLNSRSLPFVVFLGRFPSRCQNLSSGAIRPEGLLFINTVVYIKIKWHSTKFSTYYPFLVLMTNTHWFITY